MRHQPRPDHTENVVMSIVGCEDDYKPALKGLMTSKQMSV